jgi:putative transposase
LGHSEANIKRRPGRKALLTADHGVVLRSIVQELPRSSLDELTREFNRRCELSVCSATIRKALKQAGIKRMKPTRKPAERAAVQGGAPVRVGYAKRHRRDDGASGMNTDLTDAEWALVADLFERAGGRGAPPTHERRVLVNACCYVVRTGCPWRLLPKAFPPWRAVYKAFRGWAHAGTFELMHDRLRQQWRDRVGRAPDPTAAIIDAQSTRSTAQVATPASMLARRSKDASAILSSTHSACCGRHGHCRQRAGP